MTMHALLFLPERQLLLSVHFLLLAAQMALLFNCFRDGRRLRVHLFLSLHFLIGFLLFYLMMLDIFLEKAGSDGGHTDIALFALFRTLPAGVMLLYEALTMTVLLAVLFDLLRYRKRHPTARSIKETMDLLPVGIAFLKADGSIALQNLAMRGLAGKAGRELYTDANKAIRTVTVQNLHGKENSVWQVVSGSVEVAGEAFTRITASDITQQAKITEELEEKNGKLRDIRMRLDIYNKQAERMIIARELLTARMAVHNELGHVLLESRHYLNDPASFDEAMLLQALKNTNTYLLREYEEDDSAGDPLTDALEMAEAIGVEVTIDGTVPTADPQRSVLAAAIIECATNTVKHADGDALRVKIRKTDQCTTFHLSGNGRQPQGGIRESGGLASLRTLVEKEGGTMETKLSSKLSVILSFSHLQNGPFGA